MSQTADNNCSKISGSLKDFYLKPSVQDFLSSWNVKSCLNYNCSLHMESLVIFYGIHILDVSSQTGGCPVCTPSSSAVSQQLDRWCWDISMPALSHPAPQPVWLAWINIHIAFCRAECKTASIRKIYLILFHTVNTATLLHFSPVFFPPSL